MNKDTKLEQWVLKISISITFLIAITGVVFGLLSGSLAIVFDGMFNLIDTGLSLLALLVAKLLTSEGNRRFQYGYWHIEPLVLVFNGSTLILLCAYALVNAIGGLLSGGHELNFGWAIIFALLTSVVSIVTYGYIRHKNTKINSELLRIDTHSWLISATISSALLIAFTIAIFINKTHYEHLTPYIDPLVLTILTACLIMIPMKTVKGALRDIFLIAPVTLDKKVRSFLDELVHRRGFKTYTSYIAKIGRATFIEIHIVIPPAFPIAGVETLDEISREIKQAIGEEGAQFWLTICFTTDESTI
jgi:cation diffusion facilitator family transporter